jgi:hypothetical protein
MAINAMRPAHNAKVLLSERRVPLSGHSFAVIVQADVDQHTRPADKRADSKSRDHDAVSKREISVARF